MLRRATRAALRVHDGEELPGRSEWDRPLSDDAEPALAYRMPRLRPGTRWRHHARSAGVGIAVAVPAMLVAHALVGRPSSSSPSPPTLAAPGASTPAVVANTPAAAPRSRGRRRSPSPDSRPAVGRRLPVSDSWSAAARRSPAPDSRSAWGRRLPVPDSRSAWGRRLPVPDSLHAPGVSDRRDSAPATPSQVVVFLQRPIERAAARPEFGFER